MTKATVPIIVVGTLVLSVSLAIGAYWSSGFAQDLLLMICGTALSLAVGLLVVEVYLRSGEKRLVAVILHEIIRPLMERFHNDYIIAKSRDAFGIPYFDKLLNDYSTNDGNLQSLSPQDRDTLFDIIQTNRDEVLPILDMLNIELKHLLLSVDWSFSPDIIPLVMECRTLIGRFAGLTLTEDAQNKLQACKLFLDIDGMLSAVYVKLCDLRGLQKDRCQSKEKPA